MSVATEVSARLLAAPVIQARGFHQGKSGIVRWSRILEGTAGSPLKSFVRCAPGVELRLRGDRK